MAARAEAAQIVAARAVAAHAVVAWAVATRTVARAARAVAARAVNIPNKFINSSHKTFTNCGCYYPLKYKFTFTPNII